MLKVYHSNQLTTLKCLLLDIIENQPIESMFTSERILLQSAEVSQWLSLEFAKRLGIAANIEFSSPVDFIWKLFAHCVPEAPRKSAFSTEAMTWKLNHLLPQWLESPPFLPLKTYLADDADGTKQRQLCEKIAGIFANYLLYRPDWIRAWELGQTPEVLKEVLADEQSWQPILWRALTEHVKALDQSCYHLANIGPAFERGLKRFSLNKSFFSKRLFVFAPMALPPSVFALLELIGEKFELHLLYFNPSVGNWCDGQAALAQADALIQGDLFNQAPALMSGANRVNHNALLDSMGRIARDDLHLLATWSTKPQTRFVDPTQTASTKPTLLGQLQTDIYHYQSYQASRDVTDSRHKIRLDPNERSLVIHDCHSVVREVEVLHDELLAMFDKDPSLTPRDVLVVVSDINQYAAAIDAIFGNAPEPRYLPYALTDRSALQEAPLINAFLALLALPKSRCYLSEILAFLDTQAVLTRFDLTSEEMELAKIWIAEAGICWGLDEQMMSEFDLPQRRLNTWAFGLDRMMLGYAMADDVSLFDWDLQSYAPYLETQGSNAETVGKLSDFINKVRHYRQLLSSAADMLTWRERIFALLADFFCFDLAHEHTAQSIYEALNRLSDQVTEAGVEALISPEIITEMMTKALSEPKANQRFLAGEINFCALAPLKSVPFKVICMLGVNDGVFPRGQVQEGFDLLNIHSERGDKSKRLDDKYLFLTTLLCAQQSLYISYIGNSIKDNSPKNPSVLVSELIEYCEQNYCLQGDDGKSADDSAKRLRGHLVVKHSMTPFSPSAFDGEFASYAKEWLPVANRDFLPNKPFIDPHNAQDKSLDESLSSQELNLSLPDLRRFALAPVKYFFNQRLKVYFFNDDNELSDEEPFLLDGLSAYQIKERLAEHQLAQALKRPETYQPLPWYQAQGALPDGVYGELLMNSLERDVRPMTRAVARFIRTPLDALTVNHRFNLLINNAVDGIDPSSTEQTPSAAVTLLLEGQIKGAYRCDNGIERLVFYRAGKLRANHVIDGWLTHLVSAIEGRALPSILVGVDGQKGIAATLVPVEPEMAKLHLQAWLALFVQHQTELWPFLSEFVFEAVKAVLKSDPVLKKIPTSSAWEQAQFDEKVIARIQTEFYSAKNNRMIPPDPYINRVFNALTQKQASDMWAMGNGLFRPLFEALTWVLTDENGQLLLD